MRLLVCIFAWITLSSILWILSGVLSYHWRKAEEEFKELSGSFVEIEEEKWKK